MSSDDERIAYLAGDSASGIDRDEQAALDEVRALLADPAMWDDPATDLEDRVVAAISAQSGTSGNVISITRARRRRRGYVVGGAVAAAAAAVIAVVSLAVWRQGSNDGVMIALQSTPLAPGATGTARVFAEQSGLRIELNATGLTRRDGGLYYQAWLRDAAGNLVPVGTFHTGDHVTLWAGVSLSDYPTLTITEEQADNDQASSGQRVLVGTVAS